jgi:hypothetical protein
VTCERGALRVEALAEGAEPVGGRGVEEPELGNPPGSEAVGDLLRKEGRERRAGVERREHGAASRLVVGVAEVVALADPRPARVGVVGQDEERPHASDLADEVADQDVVVAERAVGVAEHHDLGGAEGARRALGLGAPAGGESRVVLEAPAGPVGADAEGHARALAGQRGERPSGEELAVVGVGSDGEDALEGHAGAAYPGPNRRR